MDLIALSTNYDIFTILFSELDKDILQLRTTSKYFLSYITSYVQQKISHKKISYTVILKDYTCLTKINHVQIIEMAKLLFVINHPNENDSIIITFLMNHYILKIIKNINKIIKNKNKDIMYSHKICEEINKNYNNLYLMQLHPYFNILKLSRYLKIVEIINIKNIQNKELLAICNNLYTDVLAGDNYQVDKFLDLLKKSNINISKNQLNIIMNAIKTCSPLMLGNGLYVTRYSN
jgi:hypothetical protein